MFEQIIQLIGIPPEAITPDIQKYAAIACFVLVIMACWALIKMVGWLIRI